MLKYEKKEIEFVCDFVKLRPTFIKGNVISIAKTNISYIEPPRIDINDITFLASNYSNELYIKNLNKTLAQKN